MAAPVKDHYVALWDTRLSGNVTSAANMTLISTDKTKALSTAFNTIKNTAQSKGKNKKISTMFILCHGYAGANNAAQVSGDFGGMGLALGLESVVHGNVSMWTAIKSKCSNIVVYACGAGDTEPGNEGTTADGEYLMGALALHTGAYVYAADRIQWYSGGSGANPINFGSWEGQVKCYPPSGEKAFIVTGPDVEISAVYNGSAP